MKYPKKKFYRIVDKINNKYFIKPVKVKSINFEEMADFWALADNITIKRPSVDILVKNTLKTAPQYVIEYLLYHEMLHTFRQYHSILFREKERMFIKYNKAVRWLYRINYGKCNPKDYKYIINFMIEKEKLNINDVAYVFNTSLSKIQKYM